jgi:hypothetical protein
MSKINNLHPQLPYIDTKNSLLINFSRKFSFLQKFSFRGAFCSMIYVHGLIKILATMIGASMTAKNGLLLPAIFIGSTLLLLGMLIGVMIENR